MRLSSKESNLNFSPAHLNLDPTCPHCASRVTLHGPFWNSNLHDNEFLATLLSDVESMELETKPRILGMVTVAKEL
jgi:tRNA G26 N,N-dimethylase Trm1